MKRAVDMRKHGIDYADYFLMHYGFGSKTWPAIDEPPAEEETTQFASHTDTMQKAQTKFAFGWIITDLEHYRQYMVETEYQRAAHSQFHSSYAELLTHLWGTQTSVAKEYEERRSKLSQMLQSCQEPPLNVLILDYRAVFSYLLEYQDMAELLLNVCQIARDCSGHGVQLALVVHNDPDGGDGHLSLYIRPETYTDEIFDLINKIEKEYINKLVGKSGWIIVTTDFREPE